MGAPRTTHHVRPLLAALGLVGVIPGCSRPATAPLRIAVASNFTGATEALVAAYRRGGGDSVAVSSGSTGMLYTQVTNGAPFDLFLAADTDRPARLETEHRAVPGSRITYAVGRLVLWSPDPGLVDSTGAVLTGARFRHLAIANPILAPYGAAARAVLERLGLWQRLQPRLVTGENIAQAWQFVRSGNAELGFVALAQVMAADDHGSRWLVPDSLHPPIAQQAVMLRETPAARAFLTFLRSDTARAILRQNGYDLP